MFASFETLVCVCVCRVRVEKRRISRASKKMRELSYSLLFLLALVFSCTLRRVDAFSVKIVGELVSVLLVFA